jgi:hypothetical protein
VVNSLESYHFGNQRYKQNALFFFFSENMAFSQLTRYTQTGQLRHNCLYKNLVGCHLKVFSTRAKRSA